MTKIERGNTIRLVKPMGAFKNVGELCPVTEVDNTAIVFRFGKVHLGCISYDEFDKYFELVTSKVPETLKQRVDAILREATIYERVSFDRCLTLSVKLKNGYILIESCASMDRDSFDVDACKKACMDKIHERLTELEIYRMHAEDYNASRNGVVDY